MRIALGFLMLTSIRVVAADWTGQWSDPQITLELQGSATSLTGRLVIDGQSYPVKAEEKADDLVGAFAANGEDFPFRAVMREGRLELSSAGETYHLARKNSNPLKRSGPPRAATDPLVGTWRNADGEVVTLQADGSALVSGTPARWTSGNLRLTLTTSEGATTIPYQIDGDKLTAEVDGVRVDYARAKEPAVPATPAAPTAGKATVAPDQALTESALLGVWLGPEGTYILRTEGNGSGQGKAFRWTVQGGSLGFVQDGQQLQMPARLTGDKLILGSGPVVEFNRAVGVAGYWTGSDTSVDPQLILSVTHHVALYPDGTVGYQKGELGAARTQGWFSLSREQTARKTVGHWHQDGAAVRFNLGSGTYQAGFDEARQRLVVRGMGQVNEGADVEFSRE